MSTQNKETKFFCRVIAGKVTDFPVTRQVINNRNHPVEWYTPVVITEETSDGRKDIQYVSFEIKPTHVVAVTKWRPYNIDEVFVLFKNADGTLKTISEIKSEDTKFALSVIANHFEGKVDELGRQRGYDSINNALSRYMNSSNDVFRNEVRFIQQALDNTWSGLLSFMARVQSGELPLPRNVNDVQSHVPVITWDDYNA